MSKDSKKEALEKMKKKGGCKECGSKKHATSEHKGEIKGEKEDNEDDNEE